MIEMKLLLLPIIGFVIGYLTNYIAVKMLFRPRKSVFGIQGVIPKRKSVLARNIGEVSPEMMPPYFKKIKEIPIIGEAVIEAFKRAVEKQVNSLSVEELEEIVFRVMRKELRFVVWIGGIIGLLIGCLQILVVLV